MNQKKSRSFSDVTETWWDAGGIFSCPDTDSVSARCQNREEHFPLAIHTAAFVHALVLFAAGLALCYGESINLTDSPAMRCSALPLAEIEPLHSTPISRVKIPERGSLDVDSKLLSKVQKDSKRRVPKMRPLLSHAFSAGSPPCSAASFEVNSQPHTGARPSVRLCVG